KLSVAPLPAHNPSSTTNNNSEKSIAQYDDETVCRSALTSDTFDQWEQNPEYLAFVAEAQRRGHSVDTCRRKVPEASSAEASPPSTTNPPASAGSRDEYPLRGQKGTLGTAQAEDETWYTGRMGQDVCVPLGDLDVANHRRIPH